MRFTLGVIIQKDSSDRSLALRDKPRLGVDIQNISDTNRGLSRRAKLLLQALFCLKLIALGCCCPGCPKCPTLGRVGQMGHLGQAGMTKTDNLWRGGRRGICRNSACYSSRVCRYRRGRGCLYRGRRESQACLYRA